MSSSALPCNIQIGGGVTVSLSSQLSLSQSSLDVKLLRGDGWSWTTGSGSAVAAVDDAELQHRTG